MTIIVWMTAMMISRISFCLFKLFRQQRSQMFCQAKSFNGNINSGDTFCFGSSSTVLGHTFLDRNVIGVLTEKVGL